MQNIRISHKPFIVKLRPSSLATKVEKPIVIEQTRLISLKPAEEGDLVLSICVFYFYLVEIVYVCMTLQSIIKILGMYGIHWARATSFYVAN